MYRYPFFLLALVWLASADELSAQPEYTFSRLAGQAHAPGAEDGPFATSARLGDVLGLKLDPAGNVVFVDNTNPYTPLTAVRKLGADGMLSTLSVQIDNGAALAFDPSGNLYVSDSSGTNIARVTSSGVKSTFGKRPTAGQDIWGIAEVGDMVWSTQRNALIYTDAYINGVMELTANGYPEMLAGNDDTVEAGSADGSVSRARFRGPRGIALDSAGNAYICDSGNHTIRKITASTQQVTTLAGAAGQAGNADGTGSAARFDTPIGIAIDSTGNLYVTDHGNNRIRKITPAGIVTTLSGSFSGPVGIAVAGDGSLYIGDETNRIARRMPHGSYFRVAGINGAVGRVDGVATPGRFAGGWGLAVGPDELVYATSNLSFNIRKAHPDGSISTFSGKSVWRGYADGAASVARFNEPWGIDFDDEGYAWIADRNAFLIRRISPTGVAVTIAGSDLQSGSVDGSGSSARFNAPAGVAWGSDGALYVCDSKNHTIRRVTKAGDVTTFAGVTGVIGSNNGPRLSATFHEPSYLAFAPNGKLYVADRNNNVIRCIDTEGIVTTLAGSVGQVGSVDGVGEAARFSWLNGIAIDRAGNLFVTDQANYTIRMVTPDGAVTTIGGSPGIQAYAEGKGAAARFIRPTGIAIDANGVLYVQDTNVHVVMKAVSPPWFARQPQALTINSGAALELSCLVAGTGPFQFQWYRGKEAIPGATGEVLRVEGAGLAAAGSYTLGVVGAAGQTVSQVVEVAVRASLADYLAAAEVPDGLRGVGDDGDGDGFANAIEYLARTNPASSGSRPEFKVALVSGEGGGQYLELALRLEEGPEAFGYDLLAEFSEDFGFAEVESGVAQVESSDGWVVYRTRGEVGIGSLFGRWIARSNGE